MKRLLPLLYLLLGTLPLYSQKLSEPMVVIPEGPVEIEGIVYSVGTFQISRMEMTAETAAELLNMALENDDFIYPSDRDRQIRLKSTGQVLIDLSHKSSPLVYRNKKVLVRPGCEKYPLVCVSRWGAMFLCNLLSKKDNLQPCYNMNTGECYWNYNGYRLPTRAEWQRAYQLNASSTKKNNLREYSWFFENFAEPGHSGLSDNYSHPTGSRLSGALGLYDILGNVEEWCWDYLWLSTEEKMERNPVGPSTGSLNYVMGGSWESDKLYLMLPIIEKVQSGWTINSRTGFRLARSADGVNR